ncbi:MAG: sortase [Clostridia bacterium]|nr:sortase [Clostridia bacterium]
MKKGLYDKFLSIVLTILIIGIIGAAGYLVYKYYQKYKINDDANAFLNEFNNYINDVNEVNNVNENITDEELLYDPELENQAIEEQTSGNTTVRGISTNALNYKGYNVAGKLEMPTVNLQYPVLGEKTVADGSWQITDANAIEVSVAIQYGVGLNNVGNTVIIGHNYRSGLFFGSNKNLQVGDTIYITDSETGTRREYKIYNKYTTEESDTSFYTRNTEGKREVSLVTCQSNNNYRLVVLAREV